MHGYSKRLQSDCEFGGTSYRKSVKEYMQLYGAENKGYQLAKPRTQHLAAKPFDMNATLPRLPAFVQGSPPS